ncbi:MAG TPA: hypothetical protein VKQ36_07035, partial [Ktedonobacterales bacterium]|nr:hypothetical protein [Ktedonobacterales bacterium]
MPERDTPELEVSPLHAGESVRESSLTTAPQRNAVERHIWRRRAGAALALLAVALVIVFAWHETSGAIVVSNANSVILPNEATVYFEYGAPWGKAWLNGQPLNAWDMESAWQSFQLRPGVNHLDYLAPPFPPLHCRISAPSSPQDTCPLIT